MISATESPIISPRAVALLLMSVFIIRFVSHANEDLGLDEFAAWWVAKQDILAATIDSHPFPPHPISYGSASISMKALGESALALRLPNLLFALLSIPLILRLASIISPDRQRQLMIALVGVMICASTSLNYSLLVARSYAASNFFTLASVVAIMSLPPKKGGIIGGACAFLAVFNQPAYLVYPVLGSASLLFIRWLADKRTLRTSLALLSCSALGSLIGAASSSYIGISKLLTHSSIHYSFMPKLDSASFAQAIAGASHYALIIIFGLIMSILFPQRVRVERTTIAALLGVVLIPPLVLFVLSVLLGVNFLLPRYLLFGDFYWILCAAMVLASVVEAARRPFRRFCVAFFALFAIVATPVYGGNEGWGSVVSCLRTTSFQDRPLAIVFPGHIFSTRPHQMTAREKEAWLAPMFYFRTQEWLDLELLSLSPSGALWDRTRHALRDAASEGRHILGISRGGGSTLNALILSEIGCNYEIASRCTDTLVEAITYQMSEESRC